MIILSNDYFGNCNVQDCRLLFAEFTQSTLDFIRKQTADCEKDNCTCRVSSMHLRCSWPVGVFGFYTCNSGGTGTSFVQKCTDTILYISHWQALADSGTKAVCACIFLDRIKQHLDGSARIGMYSSKVLIGA